VLCGRWGKEGERRRKREGREKPLIKDNVARNVDTSSSRMKTFAVVVRGTIADEDACVGAEIKFMLVVRLKMGSTSTSKDSHETIIRAEIKKFLEW
jgi:hypothetical protein